MPKELKEKIEQLLADVQGGVLSDTRWIPEGAEGLKPLLDELQPYDIATLIPELSHEQQLRLLDLLEPEVASEALSHLDHDMQYCLLDHVGEACARAIIGAMSSDMLVDLLLAIHPKQAQELLRKVPAEDVAAIRQLMTYPEYSAGGRMTVSYIAVRQEWTAEQAIAHFRKVGADVDVTNYFYVTDKDGYLVGVTSMRQMFLAHPRTRITDVMYAKVVSVVASADQEEAARLLGQYDFVALPVVTERGRLVGVITADDVIDVIEEEATEDIQRMGGTAPLDEPYLQTTFFGLYKKRIGWLLFLFVAAMFSSNILKAYQGILDEVIALAFFIPLLIGTGGNSGSQAATLVIRAMALGEVTFSDFFRVVWREARMGVVLGATMAVAVFLRALTMGETSLLGLTVAVTISLIVITGSTIGAGLPLIGRRLGFDPALFSAPVITTVADVVGLVIYFQTARAVMGLGH